MIDVCDIIHTVHDRCMIACILSMRDVCDIIQIVHDRCMIACTSSMIDICDITHIVHGRCMWYTTSRRNICAGSFTTLFRPPSPARGRRPMQLLGGEAVPGDEPQSREWKSCVSLPGVYQWKASAWPLDPSSLCLLDSAWARSKPRVCGSAEIQGLLRCQRNGLAWPN